MIFNLNLKSAVLHQVERNLFQSKCTHTVHKELNSQREELLYPSVSCNSSLVYFHLFAWALQAGNDLLSPEVRFPLSV